MLPDQFAAVRILVSNVFEAAREEDNLVSLFVGLYPLSIILILSYAFASKLFKDFSGRA